MTHEETKQAIAGFTEFFKGITGNQDMKIPDDLAKKYGIEQEPKYCDRNICMATEYNGIGCDECEVTKSQEPCEDAINREDVINLKWQGEASEEFLEGYASAIEDARVLPSINLQPKTGHWILADEQNKEDVENDNYRFICSECQCSDIHAKGTIVPYCWKCGRRMIEE